MSQLCTHSISQGAPSLKGMAEGYYLAKFVIVPDFAEVSEITSR